MVLIKLWPATADLTIRPARHDVVPEAAIAVGAFLRDLDRAGPDKFDRDLARAKFFRFVNGYVAANCGIAHCLASIGRQIAFAIEMRIDQIEPDLEFAAANGKYLDIARRPFEFSREPITKCPGHFGYRHARTTVLSICHS